ncbi:uncharacterized protein LOC105844833 isoform X2 [Hydra vulgaris]|uniref:uncharacterized protein LOC105844833 isoform X2 n=1 Tax=Hydra vulgaris TaxID=6087 RepID=UPI001F5FBC75|nr:uncharacterized protein LOC105844833 [Hydra vulgaris]
MHYVKIIKMFHSLKSCFVLIFIQSSLVTSIEYYQCSDMFPTDLHLEMVLSCEEYCQCLVNITKRIIDGCQKICCCRVNNVESVTPISTSQMALFQYATSSLPVNNVESVTAISTSQMTSVQYGTPSLPEDHKDKTIKIWLSVTIMLALITCLVIGLILKKHRKKEPLIKRRKKGVNFFKDSNENETHTQYRQDTGLVKKDIHLALPTTEKKVAFIPV